MKRRVLSSLAGPDNPQSESDETSDLDGAIIHRSFEKMCSVFLHLKMMLLRTKLKTESNSIHQYSDMLLRTKFKTKSNSVLYCPNPQAKAQVSEFGQSQSLFSCIKECSGSDEFLLQPVL